MVHILCIWENNGLKVKIKNSLLYNDYLSWIRAQNPFHPLMQSSIYEHIQRMFHPLLIHAYRTHFIHKYDRCKTYPVICIQSSLSIYTNNIFIQHYIGIKIPSQSSLHMWGIISSFLCMQILFHPYIFLCIYMNMCISVTPWPAGPTGDIPPW